MITDELIMNHTLQECLEAFQGAEGDSVATRETCVKTVFKILAKKFLYGGYFEVRNADNKEVRRVFLHTIEFYYHEENKDGVHDYIVYHRNNDNKKKYPNPKPPYQTGSLNTHVSGIDVAFEDQNPSPAYRASALIRAFRVQDMTKDNYPLSPVDRHSTHLYEALFMHHTLSGFSVKWHDYQASELVMKEPFSGVRVNVCQFNDDVPENTSPIKLNKSFVQDPRKWSFSIEPFEH